MIKTDRIAKINQVNLSCSYFSKLKVDSQEMDQARDNFKTFDTFDRVKNK